MPDETRNPKRGSPNTFTLSGSRQFGCAIMPTVKPFASRMREMIAVPNDGTNEGRALLLLEAQGLIKLKENVGFTATKLDIVENPKNLEIQELDAAQLSQRAESLSRELSRDPVDGAYRMERTIQQPEGIWTLLPVALREDCYLLMRETEKTVTPEEARRQAQKALALRERDWADAEILSREPVGVDGTEGYTLTVEYLLEKQIAVETPVQTEERTDGGMPEG